MWAQEVIVGHKERGQCHSAVVDVKAGSGSDVIFIGSV